MTNWDACAIIGISLIVSFDSPGMAAWLPFFCFAAILINEIRTVTKRA